MQDYLTTCIMYWIILNYKTLKDALPDFFRSELLTCLPYLSSKTYSRTYKKLPNKVNHACKNEFVETVWPANPALLIYVSTHCVEIVK